MAKKKRYELREIHHVAFYGRYSPGSRQTDQSIDGQLRVCQEYADKMGWKIVKMYADRHKTGTNDDREEFRKMIRDSERGLFDAVLVWKNDRFGRNMEDMVLNEVRIKKNGVSLVSATEPVVDGAMGAMQKAMLMGMAEFYSATNAENVIRGLQESARKCQVTSGAIPYGYKKGADKKFHIDPAAAEIVREIYHRYDQGELLFHIMDWCNSLGCKTWQGNPFTRTTMYTILRNERYTGVYIWKDIRVEGGMPQIIDRALFDRVQLKLQKNKCAPARAASAEPFLLTTKCVCGLCGRNMSGESGTSKSGAKHYYYGCVKRKNARKKDAACKKKAIRKDVLEDIVIGKTIDYVLSDKVINQIAVDMVENQKEDKITVVLDGLLKQQASTQRAINNILKMVEDGTATESVMQRLRIREEELETLNLAIAEKQIEKVEYSEEQIRFFLQSFKQGDASNMQYKQMLVDLFVNSVYVYEDKIVICYNFSGDNNKITVEDVDRAIQEAEEKEKGADNSAPENPLITQKAPQHGCSSVNKNIDFSCSPYGGVVHHSGLKTNTFIYLPNLFGLVVKLEDVV